MIENTVLPIEDIRKLFSEEDTNQSKILIGIYALVVPDWDQLKAVDGWPHIAREPWMEISDLFLDFDRKNHPNVMPGGLWIDSGFGSAEDLGIDEVRHDYKTIYKEHEKETQDA